MGRSDGFRFHENLTPTQVDILRTKSQHLIINGPAGTGKTWIALARALRLLHNKEVERIVIIRSAVATRSLGFLPGDEYEKVEAYFAPYEPLINQISTRLKYRELISKRMLETESTSFLRGRTFDDTCLLVDEYQNLSGHELETVVTRVGEGSCLYLVGDSGQEGDLKGREAEEYREIIMTLSSMDSVATFTFGIEDIVRSGFVREYYEAKEVVRLPFRRDVA